MEALAGYQSEGRQDSLCNRWELQLQPRMTLQESAGFWLTAKCHQLFKVYTTFFYTKLIYFSTLFTSRSTYCNPLMAIEKHMPKLMIISPPTIG